MDRNAFRFSIDGLELLLSISNRDGLCSRAARPSRGCCHRRSCGGRRDRVGGRHWRRCICGGEGVRGVQWCRGSFEWCCAACTDVRLWERLAPDCGRRRGGGRSGRGFGQRDAIHAASLQHLSRSWAAASFGRNRRPVVGRWQAATVSTSSLAVYTGNYATWEHKNVGQVVDTGLLGQSSHCFFLFLQLRRTPTCCSDMVQG